jgi:hypothetical protein
MSSNIFDKLKLEEIQDYHYNRAKFLQEHSIRLEKNLLNIQTHLAKLGEKDNWLGILTHYTETLNAIQNELDQVVSLKDYGKK